MTTFTRLHKGPSRPAACALLIVLLALLPCPTSAGKNPPASRDDTASNFKLRCSSCHGMNGAGLAQVVADGRNNMPPFSNSLTQDQIRALVAYIRRLGRKGPQVK